MIVDMKKAALVCLAREREDALLALRELGVVHVVAVRPPEGRDLEAARHALQAARRTQERLELLPRAAEGVAADLPDAGAIVQRVQAMQERSREAREERDALRLERQRLEPFGDFDPARVEALRAGGIEVRLFRETERAPVQAPAGALRTLLSETGGVRYVAVIGPAPLTCSGDAFPLPRQSLRAVQERIDALDGELAAADTELARLAAAREAVAAHAQEQADQVHFLEARAGMGEAPRVAYLCGWCPADRVPDLQAAAARHGWALQLSEPAADDAVPTLIRNPRWVRPIRAVFDVIGIRPGYREVDISAVFLLFFTLFFAMIIGDGGYGAIFLALTLRARRKLPHAPAYPFALLGLLSVATIVWGFLTGNFFGLPRLPAILEVAKVEWLTGANAQENMMWLCFLVGSIHLTLAHLWNASRVLNSTRALAQAGWIAVTWAMFLAANTMILAAPFPTWGLWLLGVGATLILLFMTPPRAFKTEWYNHVMFPLDVIGNFVDVVSYVRLFAVGMASFAVASNFNEMAMAMGFSDPLRGLLAATILVLGHTLNIVLCAMGVLVHGVRLNTLEFSRHIGMQWSGFAYAPFARHGAQKDN